MNPTVSIIVPVYNAERTLTRCIDSILNQEYTDLEFLLVNDGSEGPPAASATDMPLKILVYM
ncbi:MAG: glycosyltransferase [Lachnoclostridium sp.]